MEIDMLHIDPLTGRHTATITQRELTTLRVIAHASGGDRVGNALQEIAGDCGDESCEACSLDGDDAHDIAYELYGESYN